MRQLDVALAESALTDADTVYEFIAQKNRSGFTAEQFVTRLLARCEAIGSAPHTGRERDDLAAGVRTVAFERRVLIAYRIEADLVRVIGLFYKGRDVDAYFERLRARSDTP